MRSTAQLTAIVRARRQRERGLFAVEVSPETPIDVTLDHDNPDAEPDCTLLRYSHRKEGR